MEGTFTYTPKDVCSRQIEITYEGEIIKKVRFIGGCPGNTLGVSRLVEGLSFDAVIALLGDIRCPGSRSKQTSCPMQLALAVQAIRAGSGS